MNSSVRVTPKGLAVVAAIDIRLVEKIDNGYNTDKFELFWQAYASALMQNPGYEIQNFAEVLDRQSAKYSDQCNDEISSKTARFSLVIRDILFSLFSGIFGSVATLLLLALIKS